MSSEHFEDREFQCPCPRCTGIVRDVDEAFLAMLEALRLRLGAEPIMISSGYRCPPHNAEIENSSPKSQHMHLPVWAADLIIPHRTPEKAYQEADVLFGGVGIYDWGIHVDLRPTKGRWDYRTRRG